MPSKKKTPQKIIDNIVQGRGAHLKDPSIVDKANRRDLSKYMNKLGRRPLMEKEVYRTIDWLKEGRSTDWITEVLRKTENANTGRNYAPRFVENIITLANQLIKLYYYNQIYKVEQLHIARYNHIIVNKLNRDYSEISAPPWIIKGMQVDDLKDVLQAMRQKEKLLGMHRSTFRVVINNQSNIFVAQPTKKKKEKYEIENLTFDEQVELMELLKKASRTSDEIHGVLLKKDKENEVEDAEFEVVNENIKNIEQYQDVVNSEKGLTLEQVKQNIHNNTVL